MRDWASHTPYSDPGRHRQLLRELPDQVEAICVAARNVIDRSAARTDASLQTAAEAWQRYRAGDLDADR